MSNTKSEKFAELLETFHGKTISEILGILGECSPSSVSALIYRFSGKVDKRTAFFPPSMLELSPVERLWLAQENLKDKIFPDEAIETRGLTAGEPEMTRKGKLNLQALAGLIGMGSEKRDIDWVRERLKRDNFHAE